jgi:hypothetical protein
MLESRCAMSSDAGARLRAELQDLAHELDGEESPVDRIVGGRIFARWIEEATELLGGDAAFMTWINDWSRVRFSYGYVDEERNLCFSRVGVPLEDGTQQEYDRWLQRVTDFVVKQIVKGISPAQAIGESTGGVHDAP